MRESNPARKGGVIGLHTPQTPSQRVWSAILSSMRCPLVRKPGLRGLAIATSIGAGIGMRCVGSTSFLKTHPEMVRGDRQLTLVPIARTFSPTGAPGKAGVLSRSGMCARC